MVDTAVQIAIELLPPLITTEISLITGLPEDVRAIKDELERISTLLESAEDVEKEAWVRQVRTLAYDIEDVIEEYNLFLKESLVGRHKKYMLFEVRNMETIIKSIRKTAVEIGRPSSPLYTQTITCTKTFVQESDLVGIEIPKKDIIQLLGLNKMVAVVGMRGLGKTTVVRSVYNDPRIKGRFPICAWISARRTRGSEDILKSIMKQMAYQERSKVINEVKPIGYVQNCGTNNNYLQQIDSMDQISLQYIIRQYLKDKRYLLVFDDVKDQYLENATYVKCLLSDIDTNNGNIIMTTRYENVAHAWVDGSPQCIYQLRCLPYEKAWELFCKKTFQSNNGRSCPTLLPELATDIVKKCEGLPLTILAMSHLLSTKVNDLVECKKVRDFHITGIYEILSSYNDLPYKLKTCFLYFGLFPKGVPIHIMKLVRLWIAEGFITKDTGSLTLEETAEEILKKFMSMNLVNIECGDSTERPKTLHIHEFLHEIILSKVHELDFCQILSEKYSTVHENPRRLSIHRDSHESAACACLHRIAISKSNIRSLVIFKPTPDISSKVLHSKFLKRVHLLKVLDLCGAPIDDIPWQVGKLRNLRYLSLRNTRVRSLPSYIGKLQDLQTLDLKQTLILELPYEINELHKLRHLLMYRYEPDFSLSSHTQKIIGSKLPEGALENFKEIQKLAFVDMSHGNSVTTYLKNLTQLKRLGITRLRSKYGKDLCAAIEVMRCLQALNVYSRGKSEMIDLNHFHLPPSTLKRLYLNGPLASFPRWILELHNLVKLCLRWSSIGDFKSLTNLHTLPNLVELHLLEAYNGIFLEFKNEGFKRLKILQLLDLHGLERLLLHEGAFPLLENFSIGESQKLQFPSGIKHLRRLKTLNFYNMPQSFNESMQYGGENYSIVLNILEVYFHLKNRHGQWTTYTLRSLYRMI